MRGKGLIVCPYSGLETRRDQCDMEHIIPRALGGRRGSGDILVNKRTNSALGSKVDGALLKDPDFAWARVRAGSKGNNGNNPSVHYRGYGGKDAVKNFFDQTVNPTHTFTQEVSGPPSVKEIRGDNRTITRLSEHAFVTSMKFDHLARLKFTIKTLLGLNRLLFLDRLDEKIDIPTLQGFLIAGLEKAAAQSTTITKGVTDNGIGYSDRTLPDLPDTEIKELDRLKSVLEVAQCCRILAEEAEGRLHWSVSVLGKVVGTISIPTIGKVFKELADGESLLLQLQPSGFTSSTVDAKHQA